MEYEPTLVLQNALADLLEQMGRWSDDDRLRSDMVHEAAPFDGARVQTFTEAGTLTRDKGLILRLKDGSEFQVTIVQSKCQQERDEAEAAGEEE
jgi:hypothetical protein